ncbi:MAG TPA: IS110 family transposase [Thermoanaerobaculia bacterium]|nr:IS110 family transposase [Thermoanaerobaculia bacterium]
MLSTTWYPKITIGFDLGDRKSRVCEVDEGAQVVKEATVLTTRSGVDAYFAGRERCRVVMEAGTHSPWISRQLEALGHEVIVANPSKVWGRQRRTKRNDRTDAEHLGRQGRADVTLLHPIQHRGAKAQEHLELIRARDQLVRARTKLINHVRGAVKSSGYRITRCSAEAFAGRARAQIPSELRGASEVVLDVVADLTKQIRRMDEEVERVAGEYPAVARLRQVHGIGALTALAFVLLVEDPKRFERSRDVGPYFGLVPGLDESSDSSPQLGITKAGDELGRRLLVSAAQYILGPFGPACDLRRFGEAIAARGGKNAKKRAVVAVARKLAVLLHRLWVSGARYEPDRQLNRKNRK